MALVTEEVVFKCSKNGLSFLMVDPAHVCMLMVEVPKKLFSTWKIKLPKDESELKVAIDLKKLKEFLKLASGTDNIEFSLDAEKNQTVMKLGSITRMFSLIDPSGYSEPKIPELTMTAEVHIEAKELQSGVKAIADVSDHLRMKKEGDSFYLIGEGDVDEVEFKTDKDQLDKLEGDNAMSLFPLDYFSDFVKSIPSGDTLEIHFANDYPCRIDTDTKDGWSVTYMLAPRIEYDDEPKEKPDSDGKKSDSDKEDKAEADETEQAEE